MEVAWDELIRAVPWGTVIIILRWLDIKEKVEERKERDENAKLKSEQDRIHQQIVAKAYADAINNLANVVVDSKATILTQYSAITRKFGVTQELLEVAKDRLNEKRK